MRDSPPFVLFFEANSKELPIDFPEDAIIYFMAIILRNDALHFGENFWIQKKGTSMGTLLAFLYVNIFMGHHLKKRSPQDTNPGSPSLVVSLMANLVSLYQQAEKNTQTKYKNYCAELNGVSSLTWEFSPLSKTV